MKKPSVAKLIGGLAWLLMLAAGNLTPVSAQENAPARVQLPTVRSVLPLPEPQHPHSTVFNARNATPPPRFEVKAPANAPNILIILIGNRAIYKDGWLAGTVHRAAWEFKPRRPLEDDVWELYDARTDFSLANDVAAKNPKKLKEMQDLFMTEAVKYSVLPLDDRTLGAVQVHGQARQGDDRPERDDAIGCD
jgi:hypothetical protein